MDEYVAALDRAHRHTLDWLASLPDRPVPPRAGIDEVVEALGPALPEAGTAAADVVDLLAAACEPGLTAMPSGRFFGMVIGGAHPAALAADWLVSAWDQNAGLRRLTPAHSAVEDVAGAWLLDLLGLPGRQRRRLRDRGDDGELHRTRRRPRRGAAPRRLGRRGARPGRGTAGPGARRCGAPRHGRPGAALPRSRGSRDGAGRRAGPDPGAGARGRAGPWRRRGPGPADDRGPPGRQRALGGVRRPGRRRRRWRTGTAPGSTSTVRSGCGRGPHRAGPTWSPASTARTPGRRTRTRR